MQGPDCPYCATISSPAFSRGERLFYRCPDCGVVFAYPSRNIEYSDYAERYPREWRGEKRQGVYSEALSFLDSSKPGRLLDVGCGGGALMAQAAELDWDAWGVDPALTDDTLRESSVRKHMVESMDQLPTGSFDAVLMINVLDQVEHPWQLLADASKRMSKGGTLIIRVPNARLHRIIHQVASKLPVRVRSHLDSMLITHDYGLEPFFLNRMLADAGLGDVQFHSSSLSKEGVYDTKERCRFCKYCVDVLVSMFSLVGVGHMVSPSLFVVARKS